MLNDLQHAVPHQVSFRGTRAIPILASLSEQTGARVLHCTDAGPNGNLMQESLDPADRREWAAQRVWPNISGREVVFDYCIVLDRVQQLCTLTVLLQSIYHTTPANLLLTCCYLSC